MGDGNHSTVWKTIYRNYRHCSNACRIAGRGPLMHSENIDWAKVNAILQQSKKGTSRPLHFLRRRKHSPATPKRVVFFDTESIVDKNTHQHYPYLICAT